MNPGQAKIELSVGYPKGRTSRLVILSILGVALIVLFCCLGGMLGLLIGGDGDTVLPPIFALGLAAVAAAGIGLTIAHVARFGASLDGSQLTVRGLGSRTVDVQTAQSVTLTSAVDSTTAFVVRRSPVLTVVGPEATVRLRLRSREGVLIPAAEMVALANALSVAQCPGAPEAASWLQAMASDPRTMLS